MKALPGSFHWCDHQIWRDSLKTLLRAECLSWEPEVFEFYLEITWVSHNAFRTFKLPKVSRLAGPSHRWEMLSGTTTPKEGPWETWLSQLSGHEFIFVVKNMMIHGARQYILLCRNGHSLRWSCIQDLCAFKSGMELFWSRWCLSRIYVSSRLHWVSSSWDPGHGWSGRRSTEIGDYFILVVHQLCHGSDHQVILEWRSRCCLAEVSGLVALERSFSEERTTLKLKVFFVSFFCVKSLILGSSCLLVQLQYVFAGKSVIVWRIWSWIGIRVRSACSFLVTHAR